MKKGQKGEERLKLGTRQRKVTVVAREGGRSDVKLCWRYKDRRAMRRKPIQGFRW
jgi:hypothetical protein